MADPVTIALGLAAVAGKVAPLIGRLVGGEKGQLAAESVVALAKTVTGQDDAEAALEAIKARPELRLQFETALLEHEAELEKAYLADRADARSRDVELHRAGYGNWRADLLAIIAITSLAGLAWLLVFKELPPGPGRDTLLMIVGALITLCKDVYGFEFGSSRGSKEKDFFVSGRRGK